MKKYLYKKSEGHKYDKVEITKEMIEALPNYAGKYISSILDNMVTGRVYPGEWNSTYKGNKMAINKDDNITWPEVLEFVKNQIVYLEEREKGWKINGARTEENLDKYYIEEKSLYDDIKKDILTYSQVKERLHNLYNLIPINYHVNPFGLYELIKKRFGNDAEYLYDKNKSTLTIEIPKKDEHHNS